MNIFEELNQKYPERNPGSTGVDAVITEIKNQTKAWDYESKVNQIPVYSYRISIGLFAVISFLTLGLSFINSLWGFIIGAFLGLLLIMEPIIPILAKLKPGKTKNVKLTIPARSKETQKIIFIADFATDSIIPTIDKLSPQSILSITSVLGLLQIIGLGIHQFAGGKFILPFLFIIPVIILLIAIFVKETGKMKYSLNNCAILLELGSILLKARSNTTTVVLYFNGANSLNSGVLDIPKLIKDNRDISYVMHLSDSSDKRINAVTADGFPIQQKADPVLVDILMEVAKEKAIPVQAIQSKEITPSYVLKTKKVKSIAITNPAETPDSGKSMRELLIGMIRKVDH